LRVLKKLGFRNILTLFVGNAGAQVITFGAALLLARIYTPAQFGIFGIFLAISQILIPISCLGYEAAIVITRNITEAVKMSCVCLVINTAFSILLYIPVIFFRQSICELLDEYAIYPWLYLLPIGVFLGGVFNILNYFNTKIKEYKDISKSNIIKSISCATIQILGHFSNWGAGMLIVGQTFMNLFGNLKLFGNLQKKKIKSLNKGELVSLVMRYKKFPLFYFWGILSNTASLNVTNVLIKRLFTASDVGFYSYAYKYIGFPISMISSSVGQVYLQELSDARCDGKERRVFLMTLFKLLIMGMPIFTILYFIIEPAFIIFFGEKWRVAGEIGKILVPLFFVRFIVSPLSMTLITYEKQQLLLIWQIGLLIFTILPYFIILKTGGDIFQYISEITLFLSGYYLIYLGIIYFTICRCK